MSSRIFVTVENTTRAAVRTHLGKAANLLGTFTGMFRSSIGLISLPAPWLGAQLWERFSPLLPFIITAAVSLVTVIPNWFKFGVPDGEEAPTGDPDGAAVPAVEGSLGIDVVNPGVGVVFGRQPENHPHIFPPPRELFSSVTWGTPREPSGG